MAGMDLAKPVGPLPLGAWIVVVGAGLGIGYLNRGRTSQAAPAATADSPRDTSGVPGVGAGGSGMVWQNVAPTGSDSVANQTPVTNEEWGKKAVNYLIAEGYDPAVADAAIRKYMTADQQLGAQEYTLIKIALSKLGSPPVPLPPPLFPAPVIPKAPDPVPTPTPVPNTPKPVPAPNAIKYYTVKSGDTLYSISSYYYTSPNWAWIYNANRAGTRRADGSMGFIVNPNLILPGWTLIIP